MKRLDFLRSAAGALVGIFVGGTKLLAAVRPTSGRSIVFRDVTMSVNGEVAALPTNGMFCSGHVVFTGARPSFAHPPMHPMSRCTVVAYSHRTVGTAFFAPVGTKWDER